MKDLHKIIVPSYFCLTGDEDVNVYIIEDRYSDNVDIKKYSFRENYLGYNIYYEIDENGMIFYIFCGFHYVQRYIDQLVGIKKEYPLLDKYSRKNPFTYV